VTHASAGGRKTYEITAAGLAELTARRGELAALESEIHASVADLSTLATDIEREVSGSVRDIKRELGEASRVSRDARSGRTNWGGREWAGRDWAAWGREQHERKTAGSGPGAGDAVIADLERAVSDLASEVRSLARRAGVGDPDVVAATAVVVSALTELRRLLRR
jgi:DNA-binding PadR family transcriptional regulator